MLNKIKKTISKHTLLNPNETVIVGFSGGADSALLTYALKQLQYNVIAIHIHHGIRGNEADRDMLFTQSFCRAHNIPFFNEKINVPTIAAEEKLSIETAARQERYRIFDLYSKKYNAKVATAHNKDDQAETILMHLLRGSGLNGLCGIKYKNKNIIRPLLDISRKEIEDFNQKNSIEYITDSTNLSTEYSRNKIRLDILPKLREISALDPVDSIVQCSNILNEYAAFFDEVIQKYETDLIIKKDDTVCLTLDKLPHIIQIELIKKALTKLIGNIVDIERVHLEDVYLLIQKDSGKEIHLPHNIRVKKVYNSLHFFKEKEVFSIEYPFELNKKFTWKDGIVYTSITTTLKKEKNCECVDLDDLPCDTVIRTRKEQDYIYPLGLNGKCTLKKYFIDKKIPIDLRNEIPLLASGNEILAIIGYTVSEKVKIKPSTKNIVKIIQKKYSE